MKKNFKTKNKGFTLIELLAVIVILAVIALIAVPQILNILNRARKSAAEDSTSGIAKSAETFVTNFMLKNYGGFPDGTVTFNCTSSGCKLSSTLTGYNTDNLEELDFKGTKPTSGTVKITDNGKKVTASNLNINGFICNYDGEKASCGDSGEVVEATNGSTVITSDEFASNGITEGYEGVLAIVYLDPTDLSATCNEENSDSTTGTNTGCMKWYAYKDENNQYTMIADHNITGAVAWYAEDYDNTQGPKTALEELQKATTGWDSKLVAPTPYTASWTYHDESHSYTINYAEYGNKARLISAEEVNKITLNEDSDLDHLVSLVRIDRDKYAWLLDNIGSQFKNRGYWTSSPSLHDNGYAWQVAYGGDLRDYTVTIINDYGVRPVITVKKSDLEID